MPSPGNQRVTAGAEPVPRPTTGRPAAELLHEAREKERAGSIADAIFGYEAAIAAAEQGGDRATLSEALRRLAIQRRQRDEAEDARALCRRSYTVAMEGGLEELAAEALNTLG